ncbi:VOC family protein [Microbacterium sp. CFH 90308]|uniref:VOC family protein n=1 Tax=Microbacterium salsuginis TaxID=2722803 RepID=A0ABX1K9Q2_9MICO|nr:VOC family protein [Microbacterium sp. CFH 90308]NLP83242.1 VOC family protein [Microbacterium sp. CFH 90308]
MTGLRIEIFPDDLDATVDFYCRVLGFTLLRDERGTAWEYVSLQLGGVRVGAARRAPADTASRRPPTGVELVLEVADLEAARARVLDSAWPLDEDLTPRPWGLTDFRLLDPSGYYWRITEHESGR